MDSRDFLLVACGLAACASHTTPPPAPATEPTTRSAPSTDISTAAPLPTDSDPKDTLPYLASDQLQGRGVGLPGLDSAAQFIAAEFAADGLRPLPGQEDFFQPFDYTTQSGPGPKTALAIGSQKLALDTDYLPMRFSIEERFAGPVAFVGYGVSAPEAGYDDYDQIDVKGKVVVAMRYEPMDARSRSRLAPPAPPSTPDLSGWSNHATFAAKAKAAADHGAAALLLVNPPDSEPDFLIPFSGTFSSPSTIPVLQIKQAVANRLLTAAGGADLKTLRSQIDASFKPRSIELRTRPPPARCS